MPQYTTPSPAKRTDTDAVERVTATEIDLTGGAGFSVLAIEGMNVGGDVTIMVGAAELRTAEGSIVGTIVGFIVGHIEGTSVGNIEGSSVGDSVGFIDGPAVGNKEGLSVGLMDGDIVVGETVGSKLGADVVGSTVGSNEGKVVVVTTDGPAVGSKDGSSEGCSGVGDIVVGLVVGNNVDACVVGVTVG
jgi:hypothetical protein